MSKGAIGRTAWDTLTYAANYKPPPLIPRSICLVPATCPIQIENWGRSRECDESEMDNHAALSFNLRRCGMISDYAIFWKQALHIVKPDTLLRWHREFFRYYGRRKSRHRQNNPRSHLKQSSWSERWLERIAYGGQVGSEANNWNWISRSVNAPFRDTCRKQGKYLGDFTTAIRAKST